MSGELARRVWAWLPARTDNRRVTVPAMIAASLSVDMRAVALVLVEMERDGYAIRDRAIGRQSGWHRGKPYPELEPVEAEPPPEELTLY